MNMHPATGSESWDTQLVSELRQDYMQSLYAFLAGLDETIYPPQPLWYKAFRQTPFEQVKVIILGQDPYHGPGQAHGLSFSVPPGERIPPSLRNIYRELEDDLGIAPASHGYLSAWARQGVLLLNSTLTVSAGKAASHQRKGWETFTDHTLKLLSQHREHLVFLLWGKAAQAKAPLIDSSRHLILQSTHPSPLSAYRGFLGCGHFSQTNKWLQSHHQTPIDWQLPESQA